MSNNNDYKGSIIMKTSAIFTMVCLFFWSAFLHADVVSGMLLFMQPIATEALQINFSKISGVNGIKFTQFKPGDSIAADSVDLHVTNGALVAPNGIVSGSSPFFASCISSNRTLKVDEKSLFYLDSLVKKENLTKSEIHQTGLLTDTARLYRDDTVFIVRTRDDYHVVMFKVYQYIGGYDRFGYYWINFGPWDESVSVARNKSGLNDWFPAFRIIDQGNGGIQVQTETGILQGVILNVAGTVLCRFNSRTEGNYSVRFPDKLGKQMVVLSATIQSPDGVIRKVSKPLLLND